jgi:hypothetical protein
MFQFRWSDLKCLLAGIVLAFAAESVWALALPDHFV